MSEGLLCPVQINGRSSVLRCSLGTTLAKMGQPGPAIGCLREAIRADPANPLARFELAGVYLTQEHFHDALAELTLLRVSQCLARPSDTKGLKAHQCWKEDLPEACFGIATNGCA